MDMRDCSLPSRPSFRAVPRQRCVVHKQRNVLNAIPHRERKEVSTELAGSSSRRGKRMRCSIWRPFKAKYQKRYPEAIRSLCEDEEHLLTFYAFPTGHASLHSQYQCH